MTNQSVPACLALVPHLQMRGDWRFRLWFLDSYPVVPPLRTSGCPGGCRFTGGDQGVELAQHSCAGQSRPILEFCSGSVSDGAQRFQDADRRYLAVRELVGEQSGLFMPTSRGRIENILRVPSTTLLDHECNVVRMTR